VSGVPTYTDNSFFHKNNLGWPHQPYRRPHHQRGQNAG
jgi:hypothetical protein